MSEDAGKTVAKTVAFHIEAQSDLNPGWRTLPGGVTRERAIDTLTWMRSLARKSGDKSEYRIVRITTKCIKTPLSK